MAIAPASASRGTSPPLPFSATVAAKQPKRKKEIFVKKLGRKRLRLINYGILTLNFLICGVEYSNLILQNLRCEALISIKKEMTRQEFKFKASILILTTKFKL